MEKNEDYTVKSELTDLLTLIETARKYGLSDTLPIIERELKDIISAIDDTRISLI
jgi:hypothetical protein